MISAALLIALLRFAGFSSFTYCHENTRGLYELQCIQLNEEAKGEVKFKRRQAETVNVPIELSAAGRDKFPRKTPIVRPQKSGIALIMHFVSS